MLNLWFTENICRHGTNIQNVLAGVMGQENEGCYKIIQAEKEKCSVSIKICGNA